MADKLRLLMAKKVSKPSPAAVSTAFLADAKALIGGIARQIQPIGTEPIAAYGGQRILLNSVFASAGYSRNDIITRLIILDSLYSTGAQYNHFTYDDIAKKLLHKFTTRQAACEYFRDIACGQQDAKNIFSSEYGTNTALSPAKRISLLSKYAYYELLQHKQQYPLGFPIYDSLALKSIPIAFKHLNVKPATTKSAMADSITDYVKNVDLLRTSLLGGGTALCHGFQQFDILDAYLWRMGKFSSGNLSLLFDNKDDYRAFVAFIKNNTQAVEGQNFSDRVLNYLTGANRSVNGNPFAGLANAAHLTDLYLHWFKYFK